MNGSSAREEREVVDRRLMEKFGVAPLSPAASNNQSDVKQPREEDSLSPYTQNLVVMGSFMACLIVILYISNRVRLEYMQFKDTETMDLIHIVDQCKRSARTMRYGHVKVHEM